MSARTRIERLERVAHATTPGGRIVLLDVRADEADADVDRRAAAVLGRPRQPADQVVLVVRPVVAGDPG